MVSFVDFVCLFVCISYSLSLQLIVHKCTVYAVINEIRLLASLQHELVTQALFEDYFCHSLICVIISRVHWYSVVRPLRRDLIHHNRVRHAAAWRMFFMPTAGFEPGSSGYKAAALPSVLSHLSYYYTVRARIPNIQIPNPFENRTF